ncbi:MAG: methylmalonyl-CoA epimerase [Candidatus Latescibacteria bacterium]|nr:methylmalonyl-CoA epimerase [Candidatus Latescibacterota bacterium]NIM22124.1 methylmalonyl-CoA epimerase [Candidatus Latescibacterota bacterium]NIM64674.1 methylmalonyl-CoA epimerase [Candidatus Latescibacterota bacterium]NIO01184.1 methylmalonyl-CoA epimerase [Candidatus Latescibacterota bacterium]NIO27569.1 methylmalonyl-CoA epimerase [Candidatus Latescibacterota bacterium]
MFKGIDHVSIAVENLEEAVALYVERFGACIKHREFIEKDGVEVATVDIGGMCIELVEGKRSDSPIRKFVEKRGPGIHHIAFEVDDIEAALASLEAASIQLIDKKPRAGKEGSLVAFVHPASTQKILYEIVQKNPTAR